MERLAEAVKLAAKYREKSFDHEASKSALKSDEIVDHNKFYTLSMWDASIKAAQDVGFDERETEPIYLLLAHAWNDILDWAEMF